jgi:hypothetical protein
MAHAAPLRGHRSTDATHSDVRLGSLVDIPANNRAVRFTPKSGH